MRVLEEVFSLIAPHECLVCGTEGAVICAWCRQEQFSSLPERCYGCQKRTPGAAVCPACRRRSPLKQVWVATEYKGFAKEVIYKLKFGRARAAALPVARSMADALPFLSEDVLLVPVPAATSRVRARGYDQAKEITREVARLTKLQQSKLLVRVGQHRQVGAGRSQRKKQLAGAFRVTNKKYSKGAHIVLIDDVLTTGATLEAAARVLKQAGAKRVDAAVFAQAL